MAAVKNKNVEIKCTGSDFLDFEQIKDFQGNLKIRSETQTRQIITSIEKYGFSFPFFIWRSGKSNWCLDGHGRLGALALMREEGYTIPVLPVVFITAKDRKEAKQKLLRMNSSYGDFDTLGFNHFISDIDIDISELSLPVDMQIQKNADIDTSPIDLDISYEVVVTCTDETHCNNLFDKLTEEGEKCRISIL